LSDAEKSALAPDYFKYKIVCIGALPGVDDVDLKPFISESEGRCKCLMQIPARFRALFQALAPPVTSTIFRGEICRHQSYGRTCGSTDRSSDIPNISTPRWN
jgi:hypothetical protein